MRLFGRKKAPPLERKSQSYVLGVAAAQTMNRNYLAFAGEGYGQNAVVKAGKEFALLSKNELGERITASPAISGNELIYRTDSRLYCIGQPLPR